MDYNETFKQANRFRKIGTLVEHFDNIAARESAAPETVVVWIDTLTALGHWGTVADMVEIHAPSADTVEVLRAHYVLEAKRAGTIIKAAA